MALQRRRTDAGHLERRLAVARACTPLGAACAWVAVVAVGVVWSPLAAIANPLAAMGEALAAVLLLHAIHEGGHVLAGVLVGAPLQSVTLGVVTLRRERRQGPRRGRFGFDVNRSWRRFAGCVEREVAPAPGLRRALTITALGGPAASVVGGVLLLGAADPWSLLGAASILLGVVNAVPVVALGQASDGMIVWRLWSRRPAAAAWRAEVWGKGAAA